MECVKVTYQTEVEAKADLLKIVLSIKKPWVKRKRPIRYYKCEKCGKYHLTSQVKVTRYKR